MKNWAPGATVLNHRCKIFLSSGSHNWVFDSCKTFYFHIISLGSKNQMNWVEFLLSFSISGFIVFQLIKSYVNRVLGWPDQFIQHVLKEVDIVHFANTFYYKAKCCVGTRFVLWRLNVCSQRQMPTTPNALLFELRYEHQFTITVLLPVS